MHRFLVRLHAKLIPFSLQVRTFSSSFPEHERKAEKVLKSGNFRGIGSCVLLLVPGSPSSHHSTSLNLNCQLFQLNWSRLLHIPNGLQQDDKHPNPTIVGKEQNKIPTGNSSEPESTTKASDRRRKDERRKMDFTKIYTERNFITPLRAMNDYLLKPSDLEGIRKVQRRSPFEHNPPITVYLRRDIEMKALEVWGSQEALQRELKKKLEEDKKYRDSVFNVKKVLKEYSRSTMHEEERTRHEMILQTSGRVVMTAVIINATNFALKLVAWIYTGSHSMFAEAIHSLADTGNQLLLAYGIKKSIQTPTQDHPYGYHNMRYVASLISGVGIFFFGTGLSLYHGIMGVINPGIMESVLWAYVILGGSLISEGGTLMVAYREVKRGAKREGMTIKDYVLRGQDPSVNVVLLEDIAAVLGIGIAGTCVGLTSYTGLPIYDAVGSILVGGVLGAVASFIIYTNTAALVGRSIRTERLIEMNKDMENDVMVRAIHDVKATDMGNNFVRYKAEVDFDGRELTRSYLESYDLEILLEDMQKLKTIEDVEAFMLKHGENIVDLLGGQVDRIETNLKKRHPEVRHVDLEVL